MCSTAPYYSDRSQAYFRWAQIEVDEGRVPTWGTFLPVYKTGISDADCDPTLYSLNFAMRELQTSGEVVGSFMFYNVRIKDVGTGRVTVSGYPAPGYPYRGNDQWEDTLSRIIRFFLGTDLPLEDGREFDLDEVLFPTEDPRATWDRATAVTRLLLESNEEGLTVERKNTKLRRIRK